jgi:hypothetical protein
VIDGNPIGVNFTGDYQHASSRNVVAHNVITNATRWWNVQFYWLGPIGGGNVLRRNCLHPNAGSDYTANGGILTGDPARQELERRGLARTGFRSEQNLIADPVYVDRGAHDFRLRSDSRCRAVYGSHTVMTGTSSPLPARDYLNPLTATVIELERLIQGAVAYTNNPGVLP